MALLRTIAAALLASLAFACSRAPVVPPPISKDEQIQIEDRLGADLERVLEPRLHRFPRQSLHQYLESLEAKLLRAEQRAPAAGAQVEIIGPYRGKWRNFGLPGDRVYLSAPLLRDAEHENELAAMIAFELGSVNVQLARDRDQSEPTKPTPDNERDLAHFTELSFERRLAAARVGVRLLYDAGYDVRGFLAYFERMKGRTTVSPYSAAELAQLAATVREEITARAPLRNPIVRSEEFIRNRERMRKL